MHGPLKSGSIPKLARHWQSDIALAAAFGLAYFLLAYSVILGVRTAGITVFWPGVGFATGVLIVLGPRARWPVSAAIVVVVIILQCFLRHDRTVGIALADGVIDAGEPIVIAELIRRYFGPDFTLDRVRNALGLFIAMLAGTTVGSIAAGLASMLLLGPEPSFSSLAWTWFMGSIIGEATVIPFVVGIAAAVREPPPRHELAEAGIALVTLAATTAVMIWLPRIWATVWPGVLMLPGLLWLTARCRPVFAAAGVLVSSVIIVWAVLYGIGHFGNAESSIDDRVIQGQTAILFMALGASLLAALFAERRDSEARLAQANAKLHRERDNKLLNAQAMLAALAHEVRQPIAAVIASAHAAMNFLKMEPPDHEEVRACLARITSGGHRANDIFDGLRTLFGGDETGKHDLDLNELVLGVLNSMSVEFKDHAVESRFVLASNLPSIYGHRGQLQEVISNLLSNAVEAMDATNGSRWLRVTTELHDHAAISVTVEDSGPGIDPGKLSEIFEPFATTKAKGMGLGLAICRMIAERHGGSLTVSSDGKSGALFRVILPVAPKPTASQPSA